MTAATDTNVLYRFFNSTGQLLYIGITMNPPQRFKDHSASKSWWTEVSGITVENYPNRQALADAERRAIKVEKPLHNITHNRSTNNSVSGTAISDSNPVGMRSYWIRQWAEIPQWQKLAQLINDIAFTARQYEIYGNQDTLAGALDCLARGIAYMDCCEKCDNDNDDPTIDTSCAPYRTLLDDDWLECKYLCSRGHKWKCWYSMQPAAFGVWE